jgi:hypothetical protein
MGALYDAMCENEGLESEVSNLKRKNRAMKKEFIEFAELVKSSFSHDSKSVIYSKALEVLKKYNKTKKKK